MKRKKKLRSRYSSLNIFYIPMLLVFAVFVVYPFIQGIRIAFTNWNGYSQSWQYVGIANFKRLFADPNVAGAFKNTLIYGIGSTIVQNILALLLALFINLPFRGRTAVRTIIYMPVMISGLIMGYIMYFLFQFRNGALNDVFLLFGAEAVDWLAKGSRATLIIMLVNSLQYIGTPMVIYLAGLQNIPKMYYEAAAMDGVDAFKAFRHITLPLIIPAMIPAVMLNLIGGLKLYDVIIALTGGGPGFATQSLSTLISNQYFAAQNAGYASAIGIVMFILIVGISAVVFMVLNKRQVMME